MGDLKTKVPCLPPSHSGDTCQGLQPSSASPGNSPAGHVLGRSDFTSGKTPIPEFPCEVFLLWSLLIQRTQSAAVAASGPEQAASLLTCSAACLPGLSQMLREGLPLQNPPFSLLCCPPQQRFLGWFRGRAQSLMFFDHVFSLSHREAKGLELRRRGLFVVTECLGARPPLCASAH